MPAVRPFLPLVFLPLLGCPEDTGTASNMPGAPGGEAAPQGSNPGSAAPTTSADGTLTLDLSSMKPEKTQDEVKAGEFISAAGTVSGDCAGTVSLHAVGVSTGPANGPLTLLDMKGVGEFTMALPRSTAIRIIPHCDANNDGKVAYGKDGDIIAASVDVAASETDVAGLVVDLSIQPSLPGAGPGGGTTSGEAPPAGGTPGGAGPGAGPTDGTGDGAPPAGGSPPPGGDAPPADGAVPADAADPAAAPGAGNAGNN